MNEAAVRELRDFLAPFLQWLEGKSLGSFRTRLSFLLYDFEVDRSVLRDEHEIMLTQAVALYNSQPDMSMAIEQVVGGASRTGEAARNQVLSDERAEAVQTYLAGLGFTDPFPAYGVGTAMRAENSTDEDPINRGVRVHFTLDHRKVWENLQRQAPVTDWRLDLQWGASADLGRFKDLLDRAADKLIRRGISLAQDLADGQGTDSGMFSRGRGLGFEIGVGELTKINQLGEEVKRTAVVMTLGIEYGGGVNVPVPFAGSFSVLSTDGFFNTDQPTDFPDFDGTLVFLGKLAANVGPFSPGASALCLPLVGGGDGVVVPLAGMDAVFGADVLKVGLTFAVGTLLVLDAG